MAKNLLFFLVDDDDDDREIFMSALQDIDPTIKCFSAVNGCEALQLITKDEKFLPDFIFLDLNMPKVNGKECLVALRKLKRFENTPTYIYSTSSNQKDKKDAIELGATGFITKPSCMNMLREILTEMIAHSKQD